MLPTTKPNKATKKKTLKTCENKRGKADFDLFLETRKTKTVKAKRVVVLYLFHVTLGEVKHSLTRLWYIHQRPCT